MKRVMSTTTAMVVLVVSMLSIGVDFCQAQIVYPSVDGYMRDEPINGIVDAGPHPHALLAQYYPDYDPAGLEDRGFAEFEIADLSGTLLAELQLTEWYPSVWADGTVSIYGYFGANADGLVDLVLQVATENLDPESFQDGYAILTGATFGGRDIEGKDEITLVPPKK